MTAANDAFDGSGLSRKVAASALTGAITVYQWTLRPLLGANCRFHPGCSDYAVGAIRVHGPWRGTALATRRVLRCNPWNAGGYDPVPAATIQPASNPES